MKHITMGTYDEEEPTFFYGLKKFVREGITVPDNIFKVLILPITKFIFYCHHSIKRTINLMQKFSEHDFYWFVKTTVN